MPKQKNYKNTQEGIAARKLEKQKESSRRSKLKKQLQKLYVAEGIPVEQPEIPAKKPSAKPNPFQKLRKEKEKKEIEKQQRIAQKERETQEKNEQRILSIQKRRETHKLLSKKTKKGQPMMNNVINHLLDKIRASN
jgi:hypothetical protein